MISGGFTQAYKQLATDYEKRTGDHLITIYGPSMGNTPQAIPNRLERGEQADVLIMVGDALDKLIAKNLVLATGRVELARSRIGMAVKAGAARPDISTVKKFKEVLLNAKSVAYSDSASGVYIQTVLYPQLGVTDSVIKKSRMIAAEPVAAVVSRGEAEIGLQQISEILPIPGAVMIGALPSEIQKITSFAAGIVRQSQNPAGAANLIQYLSSPESGPVIVKTGLDLPSELLH